jgi:SAM-dependent methyltransferase
MNTLIKKVLKEIEFVCPDDRGNLVLSGNSFFCESCKREFPIVQDRFISFLPKSPTNLSENENSDYYEEYEKAFIQPENFDGNGIAWGAPETVPLKWLKTREGQVEMVFNQLIEQKSLDYICDFSAGAGYYTLKYAEHFPMVIHCDLSIQNLDYCIRKADQFGIKNILFLRMDYFYPPFENSLENIICFDSLIRGEEHEKRLLMSICSSLANSGTAFLDFHNWWHNPLRRLGILKNNFGSNQSYSALQGRRLIEESGLTVQKFIPFWQEAYLYQNSLLKLLPPTRLMYKVSKTL